MNNVNTVMTVPRWPSMKSVKSKDVRYRNKPSAANATNAIMVTIGCCANNLNIQKNGNMII